MYRVDAFDGVPSETEEMRPQWFEQQDIPYDHMCEQRGSMGWVGTGSKGEALSDLRSKTSLPSGVPLSPFPGPCSAAGADDVHWYPLFLARQRFKGIFAFRQTTQLVWFDVRQVQQLADGCWWEQQLPQQQATGPVTPGSEVSLA